MESGMKKERCDILVLDDDPLALKLLSVQLRAFGLKSRGYVQLIALEHALAAVSMLEAAHEKVALIFCDLEMPGLDGVEFVRQLVRIGYTGGIVFVSGHDQRLLQAAERLARFHHLNVLGALQKPASRDQLRTVLEHVMPEALGADPDDPAIQEPEQLQRAIENGQLFNHYQPKVDMRSGAVVGVETLVRWRQDNSVILPNQFLSVAETHGMVDLLTHAVLKGALGQARRWRDKGQPLDVAVNVSMTNLCSLGFPDLLEQMAAEAGVPLSSLLLEITEGQLMKDPVSQLDVLARLRLKKVRLSIDDFGIGYSSMAQLRDLPFDELKIDRCFVHDAGRDPARHAIVEACLGLARQFGMKTVGEGVEERAEWDALAALGCDLAQGYFIAEPMPGEAIGEWIDGWKDRWSEIERR